MGEDWLSGLNCVRAIQSRVRQQSSGCVNGHVKVLAFWKKLSILRRSN
jgi:hypothetical protein